MRAAVMAHAAVADVVVMAAAVADFTLTGGAAPEKLQKLGHQDGVTITLERTADILAELGHRRGDRAQPVLVGFAAQSGPAESVARRKLVAKRVDLIVANDVTAPGAGFDHETNRVTFVGHDGDESLPLLAKAEVAALLLDRIEALLRSPQVPAESTAVE
jgi:phosphopantothenoylcysteine decarboxylase/phosphopantothenate--cysteine ligase